MSELSSEGQIKTWSIMYRMLITGSWQQMRRTAGGGKGE